MIDYGTIYVFLQNGLTYDQSYSIVKINLENQLLTSNRQHFNEILNQCTEILNFLPLAPFTITWNLPHYKYTFKIEIVD